jgi:hypothetical protein
MGGRGELFAASTALALAAGGTMVDQGFGLMLGVAVPAMTELIARSINEVLRVAADKSGLTMEDLGEALTASDDRTRLLIRSLDVARTAVHEDQLRVLGRCLANGVNDDCIIDMELVLVAVVAALETYHMRLLRILAEPGKDGGPSWTLADVAALPPPGEGLLALTEDTCANLIGQLVGQGVVISQGGLADNEDDIGDFYQVTSLGRLLLDRARAADAQTGARAGSD